MKIRKYSIYVILILTLLSVVIISKSTSQLFYELAVGVLSGNIVALFLLGLEYQDARNKTLDSFIVEANYIRAKIANGLNFSFLFGSIITYNDGSFKIEESKLELFLQKESNIKKLNYLMSTFVSLSELNTNNLGFLFNEYHSLLTFSTKRDSTRKQLYNVYLKLLNLSDEIKLTSWHFNEQLLHEEVNYNAMIYVIFDFIQDKFTVKKEKNSTLVLE